MLTYGPAVLIIFSVFFGILMGRRDVNALKKDLKDDIDRRFTAMKDDIDRRFTDMKADIGRQFDEVNRRLTKLEGDYLEFYGMEKKLEGRVDELSRR